MTIQLKQRVLALAALTLVAAAIWMMPHTEAHQFRPNLQSCVPNRLLIC
jgi:hypothetical protein